MKIVFVKVALFLMIFQGGHIIGHHAHLHYELPEWQELHESTFYTSGSTRSIKYRWSGD